MDLNNNSNPFGKLTASVKVCKIFYNFLRITQSHPFIILLIYLLQTEVWNEFYELELNLSLKDLFYDFVINTNFPEIVVGKMEFDTGTLSKTTQNNPHWM